MRIANYLNRFYKYLRRQPQRQRPEHLRSRPCLEQLEDRMVLSTLFVDTSGNAHYVGSPGAANNVTLSQRPFILAPSSASAPTSIPILFADVITDTAETINVTGPGASRWAGSGTHQVLSIQPVPTLVVDMVNGTEVVNVQAINSTTLVRHDGPGLATVNVGNGGRLSGIGAALTVEGAGPGSLVHLNIDDTNDPSSPTVTLGTNNIKVAGVPAPIAFLGGITSVDIFGAKSGDLFLDQTVLSTPPVNVHGNPLGTNTLVGSFAPNLWNITGINAGQVGSVTFTSMQNLVGGPSLDAFRFSNGAGVTGSINGGAGFNVLDYSAYTTPVFVNLAANKATGVGGIVVNIQGVIGGSGFNNLTSSLAGAVLIGGSGGNVLKGVGGRDLLIAGPGLIGSLLQAGTGETILIGGFTNYDKNIVALQAIMAEWSKPISYAVRVNDLFFGVGVPALNKATVHANKVKDILVTSPGPALAFVFFDAFDFLPNAKKSGEAYVNIF